jgi:hypothetical protein
MRLVELAVQEEEAMVARLPLEEETVLVSSLEEAEAGAVTPTKLVAMAASVGSSSPGMITSQFLRSLRLGQETIFSTSNKG